jgi:phosphatidylglycerol:prolipoprotein diacylglycerol transferase
VKPVLFTWGEVEVSSWAVFLSLGACLGFWLTAREAARKGSNVVGALRASLLAFLAGLVGARLLAIVMNLDLYTAGFPLHLLALWDPGGMSLFGGLALSAATGLLWLLLTRGPVWETADTLAVAWAPFLAALRAGCFLNGCCYGKPTSSFLGIVAGGSRNSVNFGVPSHPAQIYDLAATLGIFALLWWMRRRPVRTRETAMPPAGVLTSVSARGRFTGQLAVTFLALYGSARFLLDYVRGDMRIEVRLGGGMTATPSQILSLGLILFAALAGTWLSRRASNRAPRTPSADA